MSVLDRDQARWEKGKPSLPAGWIRKRLEPGVNWPWALPDAIADEVEATILVEWQPSAMGGWGEAAVWYLAPTDSDERDSA